MKVTKTNILQAARQISASMESGKVYELQLKDLSKKRSLSANAQMHVWFAQLASDEGKTEEQVKAECKWRFGLPILLKDPDFIPIAWMLDKSGYFNLLSDKQQIEIVKGLAITSIMSQAQHSEMRDQMQAFYLEHGHELRYQNEPKMLD